MTSGESRALTPVMQGDGEGIIVATIVSSLGLIHM
jgi:hypothetical protein